MKIILFSIFITISAIAFIYLNIYNLIKLYKEIFKNDNNEEQYYE